MRGVRNLRTQEMAYCGLTGEEKTLSCATLRKEEVNRLSERSSK
nr:MAG TPA: hypothetical protein [Caudoviricetes sp.]